MEGLKPISALALLTAAAAVLIPASASAASNPVRYSCSAKAGLTVDRQGNTARVRFAGRTYELHRMRSDLGDKYISNDAALIIDGASAVFVSDNHLDLPTCVRTVPIASAR